MTAPAPPAERAPIRAEQTPTPVRSLWPSAVAGLTATAVALGVSELLAGIVRPIPSLVLAIGDAVVDLGAGTPVKEIAVALFGTSEKTALVVGTVILALVFGSGLGVLGRRRGMTWAGAGFVGFGLLGVVATTANPLLSAPLAVVNAVVAIGCGVALLRYLLRFDDGVQRQASSGQGASARGRREFLRISAGLAALAALAGGLGRSFMSRAAVSAARDGVVLPTATSAPSVGDAASFDIDGLSPLFTPNESFYRIDTALTSPTVDVATWRLRLTGMVDQEVELTYDDLLGMEQMEADVTIACVSNEVGGELIGNARWQGVRLSQILDMAGVQPGATQIVGRSVDGWTAGFMTDIAYDGRDAMLALAMNGEPLPIDHGFPARLIVPGLYGYVSATKWLSEIELTTYEGFDGYWIPRGWSKEGPVKTQSRIDVPRAGQSLPAGDNVIAGVAWAQRRGVERVEVRIDGGEWQEAELAEAINVDTWRQWRLRWEATTGAHTIEVRATDSEGMTQREERVPVAPNGAEGYHRVDVRIA